MMPDTTRGFLHRLGYPDHIIESPDDFVDRLALNRAHGIIFGRIRAALESRNATEVDSLAQTLVPVANGILNQEEAGK